MKQILITVAICAALITTLQAELMKLIDKGLSKAEIASICDITTKSKWITPTNTVCRAHSGKLYKGVCEAKWSDAKAICRASGGRLPTKRELIKVVDDCGGNTVKRGSAYDENSEDSNYKSCCKRKGFNRYNGYWASTSNTDGEYVALRVYFYNGNVNYGIVYNNGYVRCVRDGQ